MFSLMTLFSLVTTLWFHNYLHSFFTILVLRQKMNSTTYNLTRFFSNSSTYLYMNYLNANANLSLKNHEDNCLLAYSFRERKDIVLLNLSMAILNVFTLFLMYLLCKNKEMRRLWSIFGADLKVCFVYEVIKDPNFNIVYIRIYITFNIAGHHFYWLLLHDICKCQFSNVLWL
jgi:hypothetical protein